MSVSGSSSSTITGFAGFNSGLPIDDIITKLMAVEQQPLTNMQAQISAIQKQQSIYTSVQSKVNDLLTAIKKLTTRNFDGTSMFDAMIGKSTDDATVSATATGLASPQSLSVEVKTLPSQTVATSTGQVGKFDATTPISALGITSGNFTVYSNITAYTIAVNDGDTIGDVLSRINTAVPDTEISADPTVVNNKINIGYVSGAKIQLGAGGDTSNFLAITHMLTGVDDGAGNITASQTNTTIDLNQAVSDAASNIGTPVTDGTFTINGVSFDTTGKSLNQVVADINNSSAGVTASFNIGNNTFQLQSKTTGSTLMNLADGTGNFLTAMHLITAGDAVTSQTAGTNAQFVVNGATMYATGTTVDETITGLKGVTLNLKQAKPGTTIQVNIQKDTDSLTSAVKDMVDKYNTAISYIDQQTDAQSKAPLAGETRLKALRNQIRGLFSSQVGALSGTSYDSLQQVGITTGSVGSSAGKASPQLQLDTTKLTAALVADPNTVKKLFIGQNLTGAFDNTVGDDNMEGALTQILHALSDTTYTDASGNTGYGALYRGTDETSQGIFAAYQTASQKRIDALNQSIQRTQARLDQKQATLRQQFLAMDQMVGQYQSQGSAITNLINQMSASNK
jgi:flagellar hook-associated protein 2